MSKKINPYRILSLTYSIQEIAMFITFRFDRDWEFRAMEVQALVRKEFCLFNCSELAICHSFIDEVILGSYT
jgi:hypothetical protein